MAKTQERLFEGHIGRFIPCPANGESHPENVGLEVKRTYDKNGKIRYGVFCPLCKSRVFLNNWTPGPRSRTIVRAEQENLWLMGILPERKLELLAELGLKPGPPPQPVNLQNLPPGWGGVYPQPQPYVRVANPPRRPKPPPKKTK